MKNFVPERFWCIKQIDIFRALADADADALAQITAFKRFKIGEPLCAEGVYLLKEGRVKIYETPLEEAEPITLEVLTSGEVFGAVAWEEDDELSNVTAEAITESVIGVISVRNFMFFLKRKPHLAMPMRTKNFSTLIQQVFKPFVARGPVPRCAEVRQQHGGRGFMSSARLREKTAPFQAQRFIYHACAVQKTRRSEVTNTLSNVAFRSPASRLALLLQHYARPPLPAGTVWTCKFSTKAFSRLIGSSEEEMEELLEQFQRHHIIKKRFRRIQILDTWQLKKIAGSRMRTFPRTPQDTSAAQAETLQEGTRSPGATMQT